MVICNFFGFSGEGSSRIYTIAAESSIRDMDMAEEMVAFSLTDILDQAGSAMLAQANVSNEGILSLLQ